MEEMFFKVLTHDFRSPLQGGNPIFDGRTFPFTLPTVRLDESFKDCGAGWNFCATLPGAFKIAGLWPNGRPSTAFIVQPGTNAIRRGEKFRASDCTILRAATDDEINAAIVEISSPFWEFANEIVSEQTAWRHALSRPTINEAEIIKNLQITLEARGLKWDIVKYPSAWAVRAAWDALDAWDAWNARAAWNTRAVRAAWNTRAVLDTLDALVAWDARAAWNTRAVRAAWNARAAWDALDALTFFSAVKLGLMEGNADSLTVGIRDAYANGLDVALPTAPNTLGWS